jgi:predicted transcriptional regulator
MSDATSAGGYPATSQMRTLAVRITDDLRAQLDVIAQLNDRSVTEEIRIALEAWVVTSRSDPKVLARAETVRADIEREAKTKQSAIEAIFGGEPSIGAARSKAKPPADA